MKKSVMVGHKKVDKWCGHAGNICFTEKLPDHLFNNMMRILLMNDCVLDKKKELWNILDEKERGWSHTWLSGTAFVCVYLHTIHTGLILDYNADDQILILPFKEH